MLFSSIQFLYIFLPLVLLGCGLVALTGRFPIRNGLLLFASLFFYFLGEPRLFYLLPLEAMIGYASGLLLARLKHRRILLGIACAMYVGVLVYYKSQTVLPLGISFFTFQLVSYLIDVYRNQIPPQRNVISFLLYISFFPQLIAGPIVRYQDIEKQLTENKMSLPLVYDGMGRFIVGLAKKVLLANQMGELIELYRGLGEQSILFGWIYAFAFLFQIYFDFSGYSDMAIGLGRMVGFSLPENFRYPYLSTSITEFWRRWHMTLGQWFRDYVYIPLGGNRCSIGKQIRNVAIVWALTGLWHGMAVNFLLWGLYFAVLLLFEKFVIKSFLAKHPVVSHLYVLFFVTISFVIFNGAGVSGVLGDLGTLFGAGGVPFLGPMTLYYGRSYLVLMGICAIAATPYPSKILGKVKGSEMLKLAGLMVLLLLCTAYLVDGSFNPFLYFRF